MDAVTNYQKFSGLNNIIFLSYSYVRQKSKMGFTEPKPRPWHSFIPSGGPRGESVCWPFPASGGLPLSLAHGSFPPNFKANNIRASTSCITFWFSLFFFHLPLLRILGLHWAHLANLGQFCYHKIIWWFATLISLYHVILHIHRIWIRTWTAFRDHNSVYHTYVYFINSTTCCCNYFI